MNTPAKLAGFALGLAAVFGAALGLGAVVGTEPAAAENAAAHGENSRHTDGGHGDDGDHAAAATTAELPAGLQTTQDGYSLHLAADAVPAATGSSVSFRILDVDSNPVTAFDVAHDEDLHLVAVRRDLSGFQHVHPVLGDDGRWTTTLDLTAGSWRLFAVCSAPPMS